MSRLCERLKGSRNMADPSPYTQCMYAVYFQTNTYRFEDVFEAAIAGYPAGTIFRISLVAAPVPFAFQPCLPLNIFEYYIWYLPHIYMCTHDTVYRRIYSQTAWIFTQTNLMLKETCLQYLTYNSNDVYENEHSMHTDLGLHQVITVHSPPALSPKSSVSRQYLNCFWKVLLKIPANHHSQKVSIFGMVLKKPWFWTIEDRVHQGT